MADKSEKLSDKIFSNPVYFTGAFLTLSFVTYAALDAAFPQTPAAPPSSPVDAQIMANARAEADQRVQLVKEKMKASIQCHAQHKEPSLCLR